MHLRTRLIVAFLLLSVVPLGAVTIYSYVGNYQALQAAAAREADQLAVELSQRMQLVTAQLSERVEDLMVASTPQEEPVVPMVQPRPATSPPPETAEIAALVLKGQAADALGEAAMLLNTVELRGLRRRGAGRGANAAGRGAGASAPAGSVPPPPSLMLPFPPGQPGETGEPSLPRYGDQSDRFGRRAKIPPTTAGVPPVGTGGPRAPETPAVPEAPEAGLPSAPAEESDRIRIDVGPIARDVFRQLVPEGTDLNTLTAEQRRRIAAEINQRMLGINEGLKLAAAELQRKAEETRRKAEADAKAVKAEAAASVKRRSVLSGNRLNVTLERNGQVVRTAHAEVNLPNVLMTVFSSMPRGQGEVPFAIGREGQIYTPTAADRTLLEGLAPSRLGDGASMLGEWVVVMTQDPTGSGLRLGIARPVADSLSELRRTAGRNAGLGLLLIGLAIALIVPLSGRLTRNLSALTGAVRRIAAGEYATRVRVATKDEIGELAAAFNQMAGDVEAHQRAVVERERLKRELELGRQIQHDMQPQEALRLGLTEIQGVSVPAREVGGDFFNYFALPGEQVALVVGDVSGKGVGAALLMANIQASLRTRFALGQDLSAIAGAVDRDIEVNSPGQMYATVFIGILDPTRRLLRYVNAGHHPQYVLRTRGGLERMSATGLPVGLLAGRGYTEKHLQLDPGDSIFFYTDGCPETEDDREEMFGAERLEALLVDAGPAGPSDVLQRVEAALRDFRGSREPFDDATMMAVRVG